MNGATRIPSPPSSLTKVNRAVADEETLSNSAPSPSPRASKSQSGKTRKVITQRDCMLVVIGALLACSVIFSLSIGHQHHIQHDKSAASSSLQSRLKYFAGEEASGKPKTLGKHPDPEGSSGKPKSLDEKPQPKQQMDRVSSDQSGPEEHFLKNPYQSGGSRNNSEGRIIPLLFMDRLDKYLPGCMGKDEHDTTSDDWLPCDYNSTEHPRLFPRDIAQIEREVLTFNIPKKIVIQFDESGEYVSIQFWRWMNMLENGRNMCPNCEIRHRPPDGWRRERNSTGEQRQRAHVHISTGCRSTVPQNFRQHKHQITIGGCGESQVGTGSQYFTRGIQGFDYNAAFHDPPKNRLRHTGNRNVANPFKKTYAHLHFSPDNRHGFPELKSVTDLSSLLLMPPLPFPRRNGTDEDASFSHNNCGTLRGTFVKKIISSKPKPPMTIARYGKCFNNKDSGLDDRSCKNKPPLTMNHGDCEAHRDSSKTVLSSWHKFTFSLENTLSQDYFTEKRYQALYGASVPIVWNNHNSKAFLPDPDAAVLINPNQANAETIASMMHNLAREGNEEEYNRYFEWKKRGLRPDFVRKLFLSSDYIACRICEHVAHHHFFDVDIDED